MCVGAGIVTLQETHFKKKGKLNEKLENFEVFEAIRKKRNGGCLIAAHKSLEPILIEEYSEEFELIVIEVKIGGKYVRVITGYGPQENWKKDERMPFFVKLEEEIVKARMHEKPIFIQMDANSKLGPEVIKGDPHEQSENGKVLMEIINRNALSVMNSSREKCKGTITRRRITDKIKEESVIDLVIVSEEMAEVIERLEIDEERKFVLTSYRKTKNGTKVKESDHHTMLTYIKADWDTNVKEEKQEMYNLKDIESLKKFNEMTDNGTFLSEVFENNDKDVEIKTKKFMKRLGFCLSKCFRKVRVKRTKKNKELEDLFNKRRILKNKTDERSKADLKDVEISLAQKCADDNWKIIEEACAEISCETGGVNARKMWQLKKRLNGIQNETPTAMLDAHGNLVTSSAGIENLVIERYEERLKALEIRKGLEVHKMQREKLYEQQLQEAQTNVTPEWKMEELELVLKQLKTNKSRDPHGLANELFKAGNAGKDMKRAILLMMNQIKTQQKVPKSLKLCNITSLYKNKGSRKEFENYRGIFRVTILRSILDKLIYNDEYPTIDENMTDSNVGARKNRNIRDNIFVINAITNHAVKRKLKDIEIQIFDAYKCFDKLWAKECINDVYENGFQNDKLPLLVKENEDAQVAIKTAQGLTKRISINDVIMQGTVWGSLFCTSTMDMLGKEAYKQPEQLYKYHGVPIPPLGMVDDIICVSSVENVVSMNSLINTFVDHKKLKLSEKKCFRIHIGEGHRNCPDLKVHDHVMKDAEKEKYLGDVIDKNGKIQATIENRKDKGQGIVASILSIINDIPFGKHRVEVGLKLREAMLINGMLFNSEAWHGVTNAQVATLEKLDLALLRGILNASRGTPNSFLYLETGSLPIHWILAQRRINYLRHIYTRSEDELIRKVFEAQKESPTNGDFVKLVEKDMSKLEITHDEVATGELTKNGLRKVVRDVAFRQLKEVLAKGTKASGIRYNQFEMQEYLRSGTISKEEMSTLTNLRSKCVKGIKSNFKNMHKMCLHCPLQCSIEDPPEDTQEHVLVCSKLAGSNMDPDFVHASSVEQCELARQFSALMYQRTKLLEELTAPSTCCRPGASNLDPSTF